MAAACASRPARRVCWPRRSPRCWTTTRAREMGERARRAAVEHYSWETQAAVLADLYAELLS